MAQAKNRAAEIATLKSQSPKQSKTAINFYQVQESLMKLSDLLIAKDAAQDYTQTPRMNFAAIELASKFGSLPPDEYNNLLQYRDNFETALNKKFGVDFVGGLSAFAWDAEKAMKQKNVPQQVRVMCGLLDLVIAKVGIRSGAIQFNF